MKLYVRKLNTKRWVSSISEVATQQMPEDDVEADVMSDLKTEDNTLSIFEVPHSSLILRILASIAAPSNNLKDIGYTVFHEDLLQELALKTEKTQGTTEDNEVDRLHYNIVGLSGKSLLRLAVAIRHRCELTRVPVAEIATALKLSVEKGYIKKAKVRLTEAELQKLSGHL